MTRTVWRSIIKAKLFYIRTYRILCVLIIISLLLNMILCITISFIYLERSEQDFYATNGITEPVKLNALLAPNYANNYLLPPDPVMFDVNKDIPK